MRKRRRLADKLTIMVFAVLVAVSAFFYAPMDVSAAEALSGSSVFDISQPVSDELVNELELQFNGYYFCDGHFSFDSVSFGSDFLDDSLYEVDLTFDVNIDSLNSQPFMVRNAFLYMKDSPNYWFGKNFYSWRAPSSGPSETVNHVLSGGGKYYLKGSEIENFQFGIGFLFLRHSSMGYDTFDFRLNYTVNSISKVSSTDSDDYQNGYNAGYSAGEQAGYGNGYSQGFTDGEASVDTNEIYNQGFNAGKESVDTQSYYDAGYQAGYQVAYQEGYDSGYDEGYQSAMDRIDGWGADTNAYPLSVYSYPSTSRVFDVTVKTSYPVQYIDYSEWTFDYDFNPNHTYRFDVSVLPSEYKEGSADIYFLQEDIFFFNIGGIKYRISNYSGSNVNEFYVPGDRMSSAFGFSWEPILAVMGNSMESGTAYCYYNLAYSIYDMGPSGDTQNHIANQTDSLTNGFNDSHGNSVNNEFSSGLNDFETAEDSLFASATTGMKDFTFFDISSVPAMVTGMSFVGSIMSGWFTQAGGASGVGIVLSILFSIMLVAMVLGLYRWYQSKGGKD